MFQDRIAHRLALVVAALVVLVVVGTSGYVIVEKWSVTDSFFMTVITLSTVGYGEINELSPAGRCFTSVLIFFCLCGMTIWTASLTSVIVEGDVSGRYERSRVARMISKFKDHVIICGSDAMAQAVIEKVVQDKTPIVVIDDQADGIDRIKRRFKTPLIVNGRGTNELKLAEANIFEANTVIAAMESDIDNLLIGIACKDLGIDIRVIARSHDATIANSMRKAGVDAVISPHQLCGDRVAELVCAPAADVNREWPADGVHIPSNTA